MHITKTAPGFKMVIHLNLLYVHINLIPRFIFIFWQTSHLLVHTVTLVLSCEAFVKHYLAKELCNF